MLNWKYATVGFIGALAGLYAWDWNQGKKTNLPKKSSSSNDSSQSETIFDSKEHQSFQENR